MKKRICRKEKRANIDFTSPFKCYLGVGWLGYHFPPAFCRGGVGLVVGHQHRRSIGLQNKSGFHAHKV